MFDQSYGISQNQVKRDQELSNNDQQQNSSSAGLSQSRTRYLRNLYFLLWVQLLIARWFTNEVSSNQQKGSFAAWVLNWSGLTFWTSLILVALIQIIGLFSRATVSRSPISWITYTIHTFAFAFLFAYLEASNGPQNQLISQVFCVAQWVALSLLLHSSTASSEITFQSASLYILGSVYAATLYHIIFTPESVLHSYLIAFGLTIFGFYLVWESETIIGQSGTTPQSSDSTTGAYLVYIYIVNLFLSAADMLRQLIFKERA